jgi:hypothetical protein
MDEIQIKELIASETKDLRESLDTALEALDQLETLVNTKVETALSEMKNVASSVDFGATPAKPKPLTDPGVISIAKGKYKCCALSFQVPEKNGLVKYTAEQVAADPKLAARLLEEHPSVFVKIGD